MHNLSTEARFFDGSERSATRFMIYPSQPGLLPVWTELITLYRRKRPVTVIDRSVACRMLHRPSHQFTPVSARPDLPDPGRRMLGRCLLIEPSRVSECIIGVTHDKLPEDIEAVDDMFASQLLFLTVECFEGRFS